MVSAGLVTDHSRLTIKNIEKELFVALFDFKNNAFFYSY